LETTVSSLPACFANFLAGWNEPDPIRRGQLFASALTDDVAFTDPNYQIVGLDAFIRQVEDFRAEEPGSRLVPDSGVDMHHDRARYAWVVLRADGSRFEGFDAVALDLDQGKIKRIDGFFDRLPDIGTARVV
jgi:hypothetical protein